MRASIVCLVLLVALFCMAYFTRRRFGVLGLALCAGVLLSTSWSSSLTPLLEQQGVVLVSPPLASVVAGILNLLPAILLLFSGPTYNGTLGRIGGALAFAVFAFVLLLDALGTALIFDQISLEVYNVLRNLSSVITVIAVGLALGDILLTRTPRRRKNKDEH